ncbi:MAG: cysteine desulfurase family protein [Planctomycetota bacterium]|nr:cysteine desulfurase family protein [Planctomycetota bacterium]
MTIYLDNNATTRPSPEVVDAVTETLTELWHNPSSIHRPGQAVWFKMEQARKAVADLIGARPRDITFTSGGTEAINLAVIGALRAARLVEAGKRRIVSTGVEHAAVRQLLDQLEGVEIVRAPVGAGGVIDLAALDALVDPSTALVSIQWANNETGAVQPVAEIGALCRERDVLFHCDATQWVGKGPTDVKTMPVDLLNFSAHKFHGPKGAGALWIRPGVPVKPVMPGSQEKGRRGGTENTSGVIGMGVACRIAGEWLSDESKAREIEALRDRFEREILARIPDAIVNRPDPPHSRLWNTSSIAFPRLEAEATLILLSERGLCASAGAACSSGSLEPSPVLQAMGVPPEVAHGSIRFSLSRETTSAEIDQAIELVVACVEKLRGSMPSVDVGAGAQASVRSMTR